MLEEEKENQSANAVKRASEKEKERDRGRRERAHAHPGADCTCKMHLARSPGARIGVVKRPDVAPASPMRTRSSDSSVSSRQNSD